MRKIILYGMLCIAMIGSCWAQNKEDKSLKEPKTTKRKIKKEQVPKEVTDQFIIIYPNEQVTQWYAYPYYWDFEVVEMAIDSTGYIIQYEFPEFYEVEVIKEKKKHRSLFSRLGKLIHTRIAVSKDELPKVVADAFNSGPYKDWTVEEERELIQFTESDTRVYCIRVKKGKEKHILYYAEKDGKLLQVKKNKD